VSADVLDTKKGGNASRSAGAVAKLGNSLEAQPRVKGRSMNATRRPILPKESPQRADINSSSPKRLIKAINHGLGTINPGEFGFRFCLERWRSIESQSELNLRLQVLVAGSNTG
jgi:hypothetical protein